MKKLIGKVLGLGMALGIATGVARAEEPKGLENRANVPASSEFFWGSTNLSEKVNYWDLAFQWYQSKGMSRGDFERMRKSKEVYREANCQDWPTLVSTNVPVVRDKGAWDNLNIDEFSVGAYCPRRGKVYLNPNISANLIEDMLLEEVLHSTQLPPKKNNPLLKYHSSQDKDNKSSQQFAQIIFSLRAQQMLDSGRYGLQEVEELERNLRRKLGGCYENDPAELDVNLANINRLFYLRKGRGISTRVVAERFLDNFLAIPPKELEEPYRTIQAELLGVKDYYTEQGKWPELREQLIRRLPGLL